MGSVDHPFSGALGYTSPNDYKPRPVVSFTRADMVEFRPTDWLIEGWLVRNTLAGLVGPAAAGKSFLAVDWACRVATGRPWIGGRVHRGGVFYLAGEGRQGLRKRIAAWESYNETPIAGAPLYLADSLPFLCEPAQALGTLDAIEALSDELLFNAGGAEPALVIVDTVARAMGGANENSAEHMGQFVRSLDWLRERWKATVLAVHHTGHDSADRARGSSAFRAALDSEFLIKPSEPDILLSATKAKDWNKPVSATLRKVSVPVEILGADGEPLRDSSLVLQPSIEATMEEVRRLQVLGLRKTGISIREIAKQLSIPKTTVERIIGAAADGSE